MRVRLSCFSSDSLSGLPDSPDMFALILVVGREVEQLRKRGERLTVCRPGSQIHQSTSYKTRFRVPTQSLLGRPRETIQLCRLSRSSSGLRLQAALLRASMLASWVVIRDQKKTLQCMSLLRRQVLLCQSQRENTKVLNRTKLPLIRPRLLTLPFAIPRLKMNRLHLRLQSLPLWHLGLSARDLFRLQKQDLQQLRSCLLLRPQFQHQL